MFQGPLSPMGHMAGLRLSVFYCCFHFVILPESCYVAQAGTKSILFLLDAARHHRPVPANRLHLLKSQFNNMYEGAVYVSSYVP